MFADDLKFLESIGARVAQDVKEAEAFCDFISDVNPDVYVEIGVRHGWTYYLVSKVVKKTTLMIAIDLPGIFPWGDEGSEKVFEKVLATIPFANVIYANSQDETTKSALEELTNAVDFLFIDGDHKYQGVKKDWELYSPLVKGHVAFHDIKARPKEDERKLIEVPRLWNELKANYKHHEIGSNPGIGILEI